MPGEPPVRNITSRLEHVFRGSGRTRPHRQPGNPAVAFGSLVVIGVTNVITALSAIRTPPIHLTG
ncbi:MAG: hypothetical protein ACQSGP_02110 [Frankia sp.]